MRMRVVRMKNEEEDVAIGGDNAGQYVVTIAGDGDRGNGIGGDNVDEDGVVGSSVGEFDNDEMI